MGCDGLLQIAAMALHKATATRKTIQSLFLLFIMAGVLLSGRHRPEFSLIIRCSTATPMC